MGLPFFPDIPIKIKWKVQTPMSLLSELRSVISLLINTGINQSFFFIPRTYYRDFFLDFEQDIRLWALEMA